MDKAPPPPVGRTARDPYMVVDMARNWTLNGEVAAVTVFLQDADNLQALQHPQKSGGGIYQRGLDELIGLAFSVRPRTATLPAQLALGSMYHLHGGRLRVGCEIVAAYRRYGDRVCQSRNRDQDDIAWEFAAQALTLGPPRVLQADELASLPKIEKPAPTPSVTSIVETLDRLGASREDLDFPRHMHGKYGAFVIDSWLQRPPTTVRAAIRSGLTALAPKI